jgi:hypothetical protein
MLFRDKRAIHLSHPASNSFISDVAKPHYLLATCFHAGLLVGFFFEPEDGVDMFLRNVG